MTIGFEQLSRWRPEVIGDVARVVASRRAQLESLGALLGALPCGLDGWRGAAAEAATTRHAELAAQRGRLAGVLAGVAAALERAAEEVHAVTRLAEEATQLAAQHGLWVTERGDVAAIPGWPAIADPLMAQAVSLARERAAHEVRADVQQLLVRAAAVDEALSGALRSAGGADGGVGSGAVGRGGIGAESLPAVSGAELVVLAPRRPAGLGGPGWTPWDTAAWWHLLTPSEQEQLVVERPDLIGSADGVPAWARDRANRARLDQAEAVLTAERDRIHRPVVPFLPVDERWLAASRQVLDQLASVRTLRGVLAQRDGRTRQLLVLDLSGRLARAAVSVGDVDRAGHVGVFVGGLTTTVNGDILRYDARLGELSDLARRQAREHGDGRPVAAVTWLGYEAPQWEDIIDPDRSVLREGAAARGAPALAAFVTGLDAAAGPTEPQLTVWAHSYGSTTAGLALAGSKTGADDLVVFGSPGLGVSDPSALHLPPGHLHVLEDRGDVIADTGVFGGDPDQLPGADVLSTSRASLPDGSTGAQSAGHSGYLDPGSTSVWNLAAVAAGTPQLLVRDAVSPLRRPA